MSELKFQTIFLGLICLVSGCSVTYINADGATRRIGLLSITESPGPCSLMRRVSTAGVNIDTTRSTGGFNLGYKSVTTIQPPREGSESFAIGKDDQLAFYERNDPGSTNRHIVCQTVDQ